MGACFQAPHCHTQTMTNGNAPCSLMKFSISVDHYVKLTHVKWLKMFLYAHLFMTDDN